MDIPNGVSDRLIGFREVAEKKLVRGRGGNVVSLATLRRYATEGYVAPRGGPPILLRAWRLGQDWVTYSECCAEFEEARREASEVRPVVAARTPTRRQTDAAHRRAEAYLDAHGVGTAAG